MGSLKPVGARLMKIIRIDYPRCRLALLALVTGIAALSAAARADVNDRGLYVGVRLLPAISGADEALTGGQGGGGLFRQRGGDDPGPTFGFGGMVGYHLKPYGLPLRAEVEYAYRYRLDFDSEEIAPAVIGYKNDVSTNSVMFNLYYDLATSTAWRPYLGAGVGWARNSSDVLRGNVATGATETREEDVDNLAYSFQLGVRVAISRAWVGEIGYRYINLGEIDTGTFTTGDRVRGDDYVSHDIVLGLVYLF